MGFGWPLITGTGLFTRKSKRNVKLDPKQISYRRRGHPSCWSSYRFYSLMGDIGSKKLAGPHENSFELSWDFYAWRSKIRDIRITPVHHSVCLSFFVSVISVNTDYYFTITFESYLISSSHFTSIFYWYNFNGYTFIHMDSELSNNWAHFLYSMIISPLFLENQ